MEVVVWSRGGGRAVEVKLGSTDCPAVCGVIGCGSGDRGGTEQASVVRGGESGGYSVAGGDGTMITTM